MSLYRGSSVRVLVLGAIFCVFPSLLFGISLSLQPNQFGATYDTEYPDGGRPDTPAESCSTFICDDVGDAVESIDETDSDTLVMTCTGGTNDFNPCIAYKSVASGDFQIVTEVKGSWTGPLENYTGGGPMARDGVGDNDYFIHLWYQNGPGRFSCRYGTPASSTAELSDVVSLPYYAAIDYDSTTDTGQCHISPAGSTWTQVGSDISHEFTEPAIRGFMMTSHDTGTTVSATMDNIADSFTPGSPPADPGPRQGIVWTMDAESQAIQAKEVNPDGAFVRTMSGPVDGTCTWISTTSGAGELGGSDHVRVVTSWDGVDPVVGDHMFVIRLERNCDYTATLNKARNVINPTELRDNGFLPYGEAVWIGWAVYPFEWDIENGCSSCRVPIWELNSVDGKSAMTTHLLPGGHQFTISTQSCGSCTKLSSPEANDIRYTGNMSAQFDKWNYHVMRVVADNSGSGKLEYWINETKVIDFSGNIGPNAPGSGGIWPLWEFYKHSWKKQPTTVSSPIIQLLDGAFMGVESQGAGYEDVHPLQTTCTDNCP